MSQTPTKSGSGMLTGFKTVAIALLNDLGDFQSNNDKTILSEMVPNVDDRRNMMRKYHEATNTMSHFDPYDSYEVVDSYVLTEITKVIIQQMV